MTSRPRRASHPSSSLRLTALCLWQERSRDKAKVTTHPESGLKSWLPFPDLVHSEAKCCFSSPCSSSRAVPLNSKVTWRIFKKCSLCKPKKADTQWVGPGSPVTLSLRATAVEMPRCVSVSSCAMAWRSREPALPGKNYTVAVQSNRHVFIEQRVFCNFKNVIHSDDPLWVWKPLTS